VTAQIARSSFLTCTEESSLTIHDDAGARFARFKEWPGLLLPMKIARLKLSQLPRLAPQPALGRTRF